MSFRVEGALQLKRKLGKAALEAPIEFGRAIYQETQVEATEAKKRTPVDTGTLKATVHAEGPTFEARRIYTEVVAGGPAASYAIYVHEDLDAYHPVGQAKFIESTINESAPFMAGRIARRIDLNRIVRG